MIKDIALIKDGRAVCSEMLKALLLYNAASDPEKWVAILDADSGDPRLVKIENIFGLDIHEISARGYAPVGIINNIGFQFVRDVEHAYEFVKRLKR